MITDSFFQQGSTHKICEDYAVHGPDYVILADGCSNGGGPSISSDWGARLLCKAAQQCLPLLKLDPLVKMVSYNQMSQYFFREVGKTSKEQIEIISNLDPACLTATLSVLYQDMGGIHHRLIGDGVVGARRRDGRWEVSSFEPVNGGCFYLKYLLFEGETEAWFKQFKGTYRSTTYVGDLFKPEEMDVVTEEFDLEENRLYFSAAFPNDEYDLVFIGSDGLSSFFKQVRTSTSKHNEPISLLNALGVVFDEINLRADCLQLQRDWAWKRKLPGTFLTKEWQNSDDVSVGIMYCG